MSTATSNSTDAPNVERVGQLISGRYRICSLLGQGGMGAVYLAEHVLMRKRFALKLLHPQMANSEEVLARFRREAEAAAHVEHPNIVAATDFGRTEDGAFFLVLEYVDGVSLRAKLAAGPFSTTRALHLGRQIALALDRAHEAGIVHRDLKPENVMLTAKGKDADFVKVLDFGVARFDGASGTFLTQVGTVMGSPSYMAPEQAVGDRVTHHADLYSLGCVLYEMLTGVCPFEGDMMALLSKHVTTPVPPMYERAPSIVVPAPVESLVRKLLEKNASNRYPTARAVVQAIDHAALECGLDLPSLSPSRDRIGAAALAPSAIVSTSTPREVALAETVLAGPNGSRSGRVQAILQRLAPYREKATTGLAAALAQMNELLGLVADRLKVSRRLLLGSVASIVALAAAVGIVVLGREPRRVTGGALAKTGGGETAPPERLRAAATRGPEALEELATESPTDPGVLRELALAYDAAGRPADALRVVHLMVDAGSNGVVPHDIVRIVMRAASKRETSDEAFRLLEEALGPEGVDTLIELAESKDVALSTSARAQRSLTKPAVRANALPASAFILDLGGASTCDERHDVLATSGSQADARALPTLRALETTRGCGWRRRFDCNPCLRQDDALGRAIEAAEAHAAR